MLAFLVARLLQSLGVMLAVAFLCFVLFNFVGDPVNNMVGQEASQQERAEMRRELGLEDSIAVQFARFLGNALTGNFGKSYRLARPVSDLIAEDIGCRVYYPVPLHLQPCFKDLGYGPERFPMAEQAAREVLSLPMYPELSRPQQDDVVGVIADFFEVN